MLFFFGAGIIGQRMFEICANNDISPDFFVDNNPFRWGDFFEGRKIISPKEMIEIISEQSFLILITCKNQTEIYRQLIDLGVSDKCILNFNFLWPQLLMFYDSLPLVNIEKNAVLFDLSNGIVLGGVERWSFDSASLFSGKRRIVCIANNSQANNIAAPKDVEIVTLSCEQQQNCICENMKAILNFMPCTVICNFPQNFFYAAVELKRLFPDLIRVIAVVHNDEKVYYDAYSKYIKYIDCLLTISQRIKSRFLGLCVPEQKLIDLKWFVRCGNNLARGYYLGYGKNSRLRIGYAGRLTLYQKRSDRLFEIAKKLKEKDIPFLFQIAGTGDYEQTLRESLLKNDLSSSVELVGLLESDSIPDFWKEQDIAISCSDFEGNSISKTEAMAQGCVPVVTDTSGASDDIDDGVNGFIVPVGDVDEIVERIVFLYQNPEKLSAMGKMAYEKIKKNNSKKSIINMWNNIL